MRVFIITQDEPVYIPVYLSKIIEGTDQKVVGVTALSPAGNRGWVRLAKQRFDVYGPVDFMKAVSLYGYCRLMGLWPTRNRDGRFYSVAQLAKHHCLPLYPTTNVNDSGYIAHLQELNIDILLSVAANQRFDSNLLGVPQLACLNVHSALLPKYRGLDGLFWALVHGESELGVTVHLMNEEFDDGAIIAQQAFEANPDDTLHKLYFKAMDVGADLISQALNQFDNGTVVSKPNDISESSYFSWPNREAAQQFRKNGRRFF